MHNYISCGGMKNVYTIDVVESKVTGINKKAKTHFNYDMAKN